MKYFQISSSTAEHNQTIVLPCLDSVIRSVFDNDNKAGKSVMPFLAKILDTEHAICLTLVEIKTAHVLTLELPEEKELPPHLLASLDKYADKMEKKGLEMSVGKAKCEIAIR